jgi:hypothetical protein
MKRVIITSVATRLRPDIVGIRAPARQVPEHYIVFPSVQTGSGIQPATRPVGSERSFPGDKVAGQ